MTPTETSSNLKPSIIGAMASLVKIIFFELLIVIITGPTIANFVVSYFGVLGCPPDKSFSIYIGLIIGIILALACLAYLVWTIIWPKWLTESWKPTLNVNNWIVTNPNIEKLDYLFPSTHPLYVLIDLFMVIIGWMFLDASQLANPIYRGCGMQFDYTNGQIIFFLTLFFPIFRLLAWYVFRRQFKTNPPKTKSILRPIKYFWLIIACVMIPISIVYGIGYIREQSTAKIIIEENNFKNGFTDHPEWENADVVVRGIVKYPQVERCGCETLPQDQCIYTGAIMLDLGEAGEVLAVTSESIEQLDQLTKDKHGQMAELSGRIRSMPDNEQEPWLMSKCGEKTFGKSSKKSRYYLQFY